MDVYIDSKLILNYRKLSRGGNLYMDIFGYLREQAYLEEKRGFHNSYIAFFIQERQARIWTIYFMSF